MLRISQSLSGIERALVNRLNEANAAIVLSTLRKTSGHRITSPGDDPAAFVALAGLQSDLTGVAAAIGNATAADTLLSQTTPLVGNIRTQIGIIRDQLESEFSQSLSPDERAAAQARIDAALSAINAAASTAIGGKRLLDGSADFVVSGRNVNQVAAISVQATGNVARAISGNVTVAATQAVLTYQGTADDKTQAAATIELTGMRGTVEIAVGNGQALADLATTINDHSHETGVTASVDIGTHRLTLTSVDYGSAATTAVSVKSGAFVVTGGDGQGTAHGVDAQATFNGVSYTGQGNHFSVSDNGLRLTLDVQGGFSGALDPMTISGEALQFALSPNVNQPATLAIGSLLASSLGGVSGNLAQLGTGGSLAGLGGNASQALRVVDEAEGKLGRIEATIGGFQTSAIDTASAYLSSTQLELTSAINSIDGVNDEEEDSIIAHYQALSSNAAVGLAILHQQRSEIVQMLKRIAGLQ